MNVAYDLRFAADHFTGIGTHAHALLKALLALPGAERYTVLWSARVAARRFDLDALARHPRVTWVERAWNPLAIADPIRVSLWLRAHRPDVFLSPFYLRPPAPPCPTVLTLHDASALALPHSVSRHGRILFSLAVAAARRAPLVLTGSEFSARELVRLGGLSADRVRAVPLGVPAATDIAAVRPPDVPDSPFALVVGENRPRKNLALLAQVWGSPGVDDGLSLVSAGRNDPRYRSLESLAASHPAVRSLGWVSEGELRWLYRNASVVLFPSHYEGFGFPLVEAFAAGTPVIAADIPAFREVAGSAAVFASPDDPLGWAAAIHRVRRDRWLREMLVAEGRRRVAALDYRHAAGATLQLLRGVAIPVDTTPAEGSRIEPPASSDPRWRTERSA